MKKNNEKARKISLARKDWAKFKASNHGQGPHRDKSKYTRKPKHDDVSDGEQSDFTEEIGGKGNE